MEPFLKWVGGKRQLLPIILDKIPNDVKNYAEPFIGGGAVLFSLAKKCPNLENVYISDLNKDLILVYKNIKSYPNELIRELGVIEEKYNKKQAKGRKSFYYKTRESFNKNLNKNLNKENEIRRSAQMIFLNKLCFNGLWRVNSKTGWFNVPFNNGGISLKNNKKICSYKKIYDELNILEVHKFLKEKNAVIKCADYSDVLSWDYIYSDKTFAYFDPPYRPLNKTSSFVGYTVKGFNDEAQKKLANFLLILSNNASVMSSNSNPQSIDKKDRFFREIYEKKGFKYEIVDATRMLNNVSSKRIGHSEILVSKI